MNADLNTSRRAFVGNVGAALSLATLPFSAPAGMRSNGEMSFAEYSKHDGIGLAQLVRRKEISAAALLEIAIARAEAVNSRINALAQKLYERARAQVNSGMPNGAFAGVPFLLKDLGIDLEGTPTTNASRFFEDNIVQRNSAVVDLYKKAGLVIFGKTNAPEFGMSGFAESALYGMTRNPWNLEFGPGGSSGGAAAVVAAGIVPFANATDFGGSIRVPASCCGLFGLKPTYGRTPLSPEFSSTNTIHAITRSVRDSAALLDISCVSAANTFHCAPPSPQASYLENMRQPPGKLRIALLHRPYFYDVKVHSECLKAVDNAAGLCESLGHHVEEASPPIPYDQLSEIGSVFMAEFFAPIGEREKKLGRLVRLDEVNSGNYRRIRESRKISADDYLKGQQEIRLLRQAMADFYKKYDVILSPTQATLPPPVSGEERMADGRTKTEINTALAAFTGIYNFTGQPAMSVPLFWASDGLPIGVMFAGRFGDEATLFRLASQLEESRPWFGKRAPL